MNSSDEPSSFVPHSLRSPYEPVQRPPTRQRPLHVVLATTGSVASIKTPLIVDKFLDFQNVRVQVLSTKSSLHFFKPNEILAKASARSQGYVDETYSVATLAEENANAAHDGAEATATAAATTKTKTNELQKDLPRIHFWTDDDEWQSWRAIGDPILHIELRRWADVILIAPCSANTLAKIHAGICDDTLTSFLRAASPTTPVYLFPAMNTLMHMHPLTNIHLSFVQEVLGYIVKGPIEKRLACGDLGQGAMLEWSDIVQIVVERFGLVSSSSKDED